MKNRILVVALAAALAAPFASAQVAVDGQAGVQVEATPVQGATNASERAVEAVSSNDTAAVRSAVTAGAATTAPVVGTTEASSETSADAMAGVAVDTGAQGAANADPRAIEAVSGNPTAAANAAVTAEGEVEATPPTEKKSKAKSRTRDARRR